MESMSISIPCFYVIIKDEILSHNREKQFRRGRRVAHISYFQKGFQPLGRADFQPDIIPGPPRNLTEQIDKRPWTIPSRFRGELL